jgi:hypothetical protein
MYREKICCKLCISSLKVWTFYLRQAIRALWSSYINNKKLWDATTLNRNSEQNHCVLVYSYRNNIAVWSMLQNAEGTQMHTCIWNTKKVCIFAKFSNWCLSWCSNMWLQHPKLEHDSRYITETRLTTWCGYFPILQQCITALLCSKRVHACGCVVLRTCNILPLLATLQCCRPIRT